MKKVSTIVAVIAVMAVGLVTLTPNKVSSSNESIIQKGGEENVYDFIKTHILNKIREAKSLEVSKEYFSRCPSGYQAQIADDYDWDDKAVEGTIVLYKGCEGEDICKFKVDMEKGIALVSELDEEDYVAVETWLGTDNTQNLTKK